MEYISHPMIKPKTVERRGYQLSLAASALLKNTLIVLPTGLGKTVVALLVIASRLLNEDGKILFLAPTKPLVEQHAKFLKATLKIDENSIVSVSGEMLPEKRPDIYKISKIVVSTPQVIENDIIAGRLNLEDFVLAIFDEAHRAVGNYSYVFIAKEFRNRSRKPLILAITASPGSDSERVREVIRNLYIENLEIKTEYDPDVRPYVSEKDIEWIRVNIPPEMDSVRKSFERALELRYRRFERLGLEIDLKGLTKKEILGLQEALQTQAGESGEQVYFEALSILAEIMKIQHAIELIETQGLEALKKYLKRLFREAKGRGSRASKSLFEDPVFRDAMIKAMKINIEHPKVKKLLEILKKQLDSNSESRIIVFTNFRDTADKITEILKEKGFRAEKFIGQANREDDRGMSQKRQIEVLDSFRAGEINVLVSTSVGEEGLDIPATDLVIFYEAVPSEIRAIQRKGRTGRGREGRIAVLITRGTRDEAYYWASVRKEKMMYDMLYRIKDELAERKSEESLARYIDYEEDQKVIIFADSREMRSSVVKKLRERGAKIEIKSLEVADYVLSERVAVERKTAEDFVNSLIGKERLFSQLINLKKSYQRPLLIIEGENLYGRRMVSPAAIRGAIATITVDFGIPVIFTKNEDETAEFLTAIAKREQEIKKREITLHSDKTKRSLKEELEYVVSAIPDVGPVIAKNLLSHFKTLRNLANADVEELKKVPKVGDKTAEKIWSFFNAEYYAEE
ncbi:DEAD/DEAH box helicase [Geoglobus acetivorans]|uniref:ATP-dependent RNA helicase, EIF-4A family n=1 Tax=Geoglobus acetivorans TaxID=565033 RepID=A0A0A7GEA4_GEOAI|nr:ATP-dependent RNA helicase, EIF-4A family [Geoglobus acetivorans]